MKKSMIFILVLLFALVTVPTYAGPPGGPPEVVIDPGGGGNIGGDDIGGTQDYPVYMSSSVSHPDYFTTAKIEEAYDVDFINITTEKSGFYNIYSSNSNIDLQVRVVERLHNHHLNGNEYEMFEENSVSNDFDIQALYLSRNKKYQLQIYSHSHSTSNEFNISLVRTIGTVYNVGANAEILNANQSITDFDSAAIYYAPPYQATNSDQKNIFSFRNRVLLDEPRDIIKPTLFFDDGHIISNDFVNYDSDLSYGFPTNSYTFRFDNNQSDLSLGNPNTNPMGSLDVFREGIDFVLSYDALIFERISNGNSGIGVYNEEQPDEVVYTGLVPFAAVGQGANHYMLSSQCSINTWEKHVDLGSVLVQQYLNYTPYFPLYSPVNNEFIGYQLVLSYTGFNIFEYGNTTSYYNQLIIILDNDIIF